MKGAVSATGEILVPAEIRDQLGLQPGTVVSFEITDDGVLLRKGEAEPLDEITWGTSAGQPEEGLFWEPLAAAPAPPALPARRGRAFLPVALPLAAMLLLAGLIVFKGHPAPLKVAPPPARAPAPVPVQAPVPSAAPSPIIPEAPVEDTEPPPAPVQEAAEEPAPEPVPIQAQAGPPRPAAARISSAARATARAPRRRGDLIQPGPGVAVPVPLEMPSFAYPAAARGRGEDVDVRLELLVDEHGRVIDAVVREGGPAGLGFDEAALAAARRVPFQPGTRNDVPAKMWTEMIFSFSDSHPARQAGR